MLRYTRMLAMLCWDTRNDYIVPTPKEGVSCQ